MATVETVSLVVGLISGIIAIIDETKKVYDAANDITGLPRAFREVAERLPIVKITLDKVDKKKGRTDEEKNAVVAVLKSCEAKSAELEAIFKDVLPEKDSRLERYYKAVRIIGKGKPVEVLFTGILKDLKLLGINSIEEVSEAIDAMLAVEPSIPSEAGTYHNYGPGPQNVKNGPGDLNSNSGDGNQFIGPNMTFAYGAFANPVFTGPIRCEIEVAGVEQTETATAALKKNKARNTALDVYSSI